MGNLFLIIFFSTFISEDITCITSGILAKEGKLSVGYAIFFTGFGIFVGDLLLYFFGFLIRLFFKKWEQKDVWEKKLTSNKLYIHWKSNFTSSILISRFLPGTRLPLYVLSGYFHQPLMLFIVTSFFAVSLWTSSIVMLVYAYGMGLGLYLDYKSNIWSILWIGISFYVLFVLVQTILIREKRDSFIIKCKKWTKLEFWPSYIFYLPLIPYLIYLSIKYRGVRFLTTTNPGIIASGIAGESKFQILNLIPTKHRSKSLFVQTNILQKTKLVKKWMGTNQIKFPIIAKPDKGERGFLVQKIKSFSELEFLFQTYPIDWLVQEWCRGPFEVGVFYYRNPNESNGRIFSITEKVFPKITGDGFNTLETLIESHPRYQFQKDTHKKHNEKNLHLILEKGKTISIGAIGNHIQGCMFQDGYHLLTPKLEKELVNVGDHTKGFYFGRFDIRFSNLKKFQDGKDFKIIELNGVTSESTNLYDPNFTILQSYSILFKQWKLIFEIGSRNYINGVALTPYSQLYRLVLDHNQYRKKFSRLETSR
ncbi:SNARE-like domain protein [Leptospira sp. WS39.C2]